MTKVLFICVSLILCFGHLGAQTNTTEDADKANRELERLKVKSGYMMAAGTLFSCTGVIIVAVGAHNISLGQIYDYTVSGPVITDYRPRGRILVATGAGIFAGAVALLSSGIYFRTIYLNKKKAANVSTGYLGGSSIGIAVKF